MALLRPAFRSLVLSLGTEKYCSIIPCDYRSIFTCGKSVLSVAVHVLRPFASASSVRLLSTADDSTSQNKTSASLFSFASPMDWWKNRQEKKQDEKYRQRIMEMASKESFTISDMHAEIKEVASDWKNKIPGLSGSEELKIINKMNLVLASLVEVMGHEATEDALDNMTRKQKLEVAVKGKTTLEEVNALTQQFQTMSLMHRVLRKRKLENKSIPVTTEGIQALVQADGPKMLSKAHKERMKAFHQLKARRGPRRR